MIRSMSWVIACMLAQMVHPDMSVAADEQPATASSTQTAAAHVSAPAVASWLALQDEGPRYGHLVEGVDSLPFQEAVSAFMHGQYAVAHAGFLALVTRDADSMTIAAATAFLAELAVREDPTSRGRSAAITQYRTLVRVHPKDTNSSRALWRIGDLYVAMGWFQEAIAAYEYAVSHVMISTDADRSLLSLAGILALRERWEEAERAFGSVRNRTVDERVLMRAVAGQAVALHALHRKQEAEPLFDMLYRRWPHLLKRDSRLLQQYGDILEGTDKFQRARAIDMLLYNLYPGSPSAGKALVRLGDTHRQLGLPEAAEMFYFVVEKQYAGRPEAGLARIRLARIEQEIAASAGDAFMRKKVEGIIRGGRASYLESSDAEALYIAIAKEFPDDPLGSEAMYQLAGHYEFR
ncbi:MAG: tetratricopeptide repeat protein, partial [Nitrospira sp.]|nr:tetratricopeptide repeat protein [Nitrospira sp.]